MTWEVIEPLLVAGLTITLAWLLVTGLFGSILVAYIMVAVAQKRDRAKKFLQRRKDA